MTTPQHGVMTYCVCRLLGIKRWIAIVCGIIGMLPDLIAFPQTIQGNWHGLYLWTHETIFEHWWNLWQVIVFPWGLHTSIDYLVHIPSGGWYWWTYVLEVLLWITELYWFFYLKNTNQTEKL